jgi:hypothetical protein
LFRGAATHPARCPVCGSYRPHISSLLTQQIDKLADRTRARRKFIEVHMTVFADNNRRLCDDVCRSQYKAPLILSVQYCQSYSLLR